MCRARFACSKAEVLRAKVKSELTVTPAKFDMLARVTFLECEAGQRRQAALDVTKKVLAGTPHDWPNLVGVVGEAVMENIFEQQRVCERNVVPKRPKEEEPELHQWQCLRKLKKKDFVWPKRQSEDNVRNGISINGWPNRRCKKVALVGTLIGATPSAGQSRHFHLHTEEPHVDSCRSSYGSSCCWCHLRLKGLCEPSASFPTEVISDDDWGRREIVYATCSLRGTEGISNVGVVPCASGHIIRALLSARSIPDVALVLHVR